MSALDPTLDLPHGPFDDPATVENYQWLAMNDAGIGLICHLGTAPGDATLWHTLSAVSLPSGEVYVAKAVGRPADTASAGTPLHGMQCEAPFERWRFHADAGFQRTDFAELGAGPLHDRPTTAVAIDVAFTMAGPVWNPAGSEDQPDWGTFHLEQAIRANGTVQVGAEKFDFDGLGFRDHSRGHRDLRNVEHSFWCNGTFPSGRTFASLQVTNRDGHTESRAAISDGGPFVDARIVETPAIHHPNHDPLEIKLVLGDNDGTDHQISGLVSGGATWSIVGGSEFCMGAAIDVPDAYLLPQSIIKWNWDGETGYGLADRCGLTSYFTELETTP